MVRLQYGTNELNFLDQLFFPVNLFASGNFAEKTRFEASWVFFFWSSCCKKLKRTTKLFTGRTLLGLLIQVQNISLGSPGMRRKQIFVLGLKKTTTTTQRS